VLGGVRKRALRAGRRAQAATAPPVPLSLATVHHGHVGQRRAQAPTAPPVPLPLATVHHGHVGQRALRDGASRTRWTARASSWVCRFAATPPPGTNAPTAHAAAPPEFAAAPRDAAAPRAQH